MNDMSFWLGWSFGVLCGIVFVTGGVWIALLVQTARSTDRRTFAAMAATEVGPNIIQQILLSAFLLLWAFVEAVGQMRPAKKISALNAQGANAPERITEVKEFRFRLPFLLGLVLTVVFSFLFPAKAAVAARATGFDLPTFLMMPVGDLLTTIFSVAVLGTVIAFVLGYLHVDPVRIPVITNILVAVIGAAAAAGLKFIPPEWMAMTVWQALLAIFAFLTALAGVRVGGLWQLAQVKDVTPRMGALAAGEYDPLEAARALAMV